MLVSLLLTTALAAAAPTSSTPALDGGPKTVAMPGGEYLWPQFRGPGGEGHVGQTGLPLEWSDTEGKQKNVVWKTSITGLGWSSAVIHGDQVWITTAVELPLPQQPEPPPEPAPQPKADEPKKDGDAKPAPAPKKPEVYPPIELRVLCLDRESGRIVHDVLLFKIDQPGRIHKKNSHASPTPLLDGDRLYLHFGRHGTACVTTAGEIVWKTQELVYEHRHGPGGSPVVHGNLLLLSCDGTDVQYVVALDKATGKIVWKQPRKGRMAYTTPILVDVAGQTQLISSGGDAVMGYEPATGKEIWQCKYDGYSLVPRPVVGHGLVFVCTGYDTPGMYAIRLGGTGDVTETHVAWKMKKGAPLNPSPILVGDELYVVNDKGIATCMNAVTGEELWQERIGGNFSASPLLADGRLYLLDEDGKCTVIAAAKEFKKLAENVVDGRTLASLSAAGKSIFLRTDTHLYRLEVR
jgi:outer membrane protein assembly factor BamB